MNMDGLETLRQAVQQAPFRSGMKFRPYLHRLYPCIRAALDGSYSRRAVWEILQQEGGYPGALRTFYTTLERVEAAFPEMVPDAVPDITASPVPVPSPPATGSAALRPPPEQGTAGTGKAGGTENGRPAPGQPLPAEASSPVIFPEALPTTAPASPLPPLPPAPLSSAFPPPAPPDPETTGGNSIRLRHARTVDALFDNPLPRNPLLKR